MKSGLAFYWVRFLRHLGSLVTVYLPDSKSVFLAQLVNVLLEKMLDKRELVFENSLQELVVGTVQVIEHPRVEKLQLGQKQLQVAVLFICFQAALLFEVITEEKAVTFADDYVKLLFALLCTCSEGFSDEVFL